MADAPSRDLPDIPGFTIRRELGKGSMGIVYEAQREGDGTQVALKVLPPSLLVSERSRARFQREGRILSRISHPGLVRVFEQGITGSLHWFAMELVEGTNLGERLQAGPLPIRQAAEIGVAAARALQAAHDHGVVHRDLKPGNMLLRGTGEHPIAISDFGLARDLDTASVTESGALVGTPIYMAPEVILGQTEQEVPATLADIYSLGATLYHGVTGHPPFSGPTAQSVLRAVVDRDPVPAARLRRDLPTPFAAVITKAMARSPADRYGAAAELADDLERMLTGERVHARLPGLMVRAWRTARCHPLVSGLVMLLAALGVGFLAVEQEREAEAVRRALAEAESLLVRAATAVDESGDPLTPTARMGMLDRAELLTTEVLMERPEAWRPALLRARIRLDQQRPGEALPDVAAALARQGVDRVAARLLRIQILQQMPGPGHGVPCSRSCRRCSPRTAAAPPDAQWPSTC